MTLREELSKSQERSTEEDIIVKRHGNEIPKFKIFHGKKKIASRNNKRKQIQKTYQLYKLKNTLLKQ